MCNIGKKGGPLMFTRRL